MTSQPQPRGRGRPAIGAVVEARLPPEEHAALAAFAGERGMKIAAVVRTAVQQYLTREKTMITTTITGQDTTYTLAYEVPGDGEDAWVIRSEHDGEISAPREVLDAPRADVEQAQQWATEQLGQSGVTVTGWTRLSGMDWDTYQAEVRATGTTAVLIVAAAGDGVPGVDLALVDPALDPDTVVWLAEQGYGPDDPDTTCTVLLGQDLDDAQVEGWPTRRISLTPQEADRLRASC